MIPSQEKVCERAEPYQNCLRNLPNLVTFQDWTWPDLLWRNLTTCHELSRSNYKTLLESHAQTRFKRLEFKPPRNSKLSLITFGSALDATLKYGHEDGDEIHFMKSKIVKPTGDEDIVAVNVPPWLSRYFEPRSDILDFTPHRGLTYMPVSDISNDGTDDDTDDGFDDGTDFGFDDERDDGTDDNDDSN